MTTAIRYQQHDKAGRFGREVRTVPDGGEMGGATTPARTDGAADRFDAVGYEIDAHAVAGAILARLAAGGTLRLAPSGDRRPSVLEAAPRAGA
jgi:hypothetical protein